MPANRIADNFAANVRLFRRLRGLTQVELASRVGLSAPFISRLENQGRDDYTLSTLSRFADALEVSPHQLIVEPAKKIRARA